jgi:hypothetical protein
MLPILSLMPDQMTKTPSASPISPPHNSELFSLLRRFDVVAHAFTLSGTAFDLDHRHPEVAKRSDTLEGLRCPCSIAANAASHLPR